MFFGFKYFHKMKTPNGTLNANLASEPDALDPALSRSFDGACLTLLAFSGLYSYNEEGSLVPELSDGEPEVSEDGLTYTFKIKDGLKWSDGQFDFAREGWYADYNDPINMLEVWMPDSGNNNAQFGR